MSEFQLTTPVAFIIFNRPDTTERVFAEIARARPPKLLVVGDGPRANRPGEAEKVAACRAIIDRVDWPCEVLTNYSEANLGCKVRVSSGLDWVFEQVPEAIILEDDCLPHPTFFRFCQELLERYRDDERIGMISGNNFQFGQSVTQDSYYFSKYTHIWGWATWRRAWSGYDVQANIWPKFQRAGWLKQVSANAGEEAHWREAFQSVYDSRMDTWDYQWTLRCFAQGQISVMPNVNLISNIGFGENATHTFGDSIYANMPISEVVFPLIHPEIFRPNANADAYTANSNFKSTYFQRFKKVIHLLVSRRDK
jgi:hypothetical protein